jgi:glycosyltransferase involved in cell wall biosynthesis
MTGSLPKVSIILPTYNGENYIQQSIDSCLNQNYKNIELIIVDDASTDKTLEIIKSYKDERIKYLRHETNKGLPQALNTGFARATGEYLTWTSDDNYYANEAIEKMLYFLENKKCSFVYCDYYKFKDENPSNTQEEIRLSDVLRLEDYNGVGACFLYSRKVKEYIRDYDPDTFLAEDYDYWIRVSKKFSMCHLNVPLYYYRVHKESLYASKYYEVNVVDFLVRIKNNIADARQVNNLLINLMVERNLALMHKPLKAVFFVFKVITFRRVGTFKLYRILMKIRFSRQISRVLREFHKGIISFKYAKLRLTLLLNNRFLI